MAFNALAKKLRWQDARRALVLDAPDGFLQSLGELPTEIQIEVKPAGEFDFAHLFVENRAELDRLVDQVLAAIEYDSVLWISYPKGSSGVETDLNRDKLRQALSDKGIRPVAQVSIDKTWSAMRFRPHQEVGR